MRKVKFQHDNCPPARLVHPLFISLHVQASRATHGARVTCCDNPGEVLRLSPLISGWFQMHSRWTLFTVAQGQLNDPSQGLWTHSSIGTLSPKSNWEENTLAKTWALFILARLPILLRKRKILLNLKVKISQRESCKTGLLLDPGSQSNLDSQICAFSFFPTDFQ